MSLNDLLDAASLVSMEDEDKLFDDFIYKFYIHERKSYPKPILKLLKFKQKYPEYIWAEEINDRLELVYNRKVLIKESNEGKTKFQYFERGLFSMKIKLCVLETTHGKNMKRICFLSDTENYNYESKQMLNDYNFRVKRVKIED